MAQYPYPNWIVPPDLAGEYSRGVQLGQAAAQAQLAEQQHQRDYLQKQQQLEVDRAFKEQQFQMDKQALAQEQQMNAQKIQDAAQRLTAQKAFQDYVNALGPNPDPDQIIQGMMKYGIGMGTDSSGFYSMVAKQAAAKHPFVPSEMTTPSGTRMVQLSPNRFELAPSEKPKKMSDESRMELTDAYKQLDEARRNEITDVNPKHRQANRDKVVQAMDRIRSIISPSDTTMTKPSTPEQKLEAAKALRKQHPDWTKQQIIDAVNQ